MIPFNTKQDFERKVVCLLGTTFSGALEHLLTNVEIAQKMGQKGFEKAKLQFSFESNLNQLESYLCDDIYISDAI